MQTPNSQEEQRTEETRILDQLVADMPTISSLQDLIQELKAKFGHYCQEKIERCEKFAEKWNTKISKNDRRN